MPEQNDLTPAGSDDAYCVSGFINEGVVIAVAPHPGCQEFSGFALVTRRTWDGD